MSSIENLWYHTRTKDQPRCYLFGEGCVRETSMLPEVVNYVDESGDRR